MRTFPTAIRIWRWTTTVSKAGKLDLVRRSLTPNKKESCPRPNFVLRSRTTHGATLQLIAPSSKEAEEGRGLTPQSPMELPLSSQLSIGSLSAPTVGNGVNRATLTLHAELVRPTKSGVYESCAKRETGAKVDAVLACIQESGTSGIRSG
jgi:hypothetical protein